MSYYDFLEDMYFGGLNGYIRSERKKANRRKRRRARIAREKKLALQAQPDKKEGES